MSSRNYQGIVQTLNVQPRVITGSFAPNGSSAIDATSRLGLGFTVAYTSTGLYTVTFSDSFSYLLSCNLTLGLNAAADTVLQLGVYSSSAKTLQIRALTAGALADIAANANNRIHFTCVFQDSSVTPVYGA